MPDDQYPAFEGGQTLTAHDLNQLRAFLHQRDRLLGRLIGFGVSCGLGGTVTGTGAGTTLTIGAGLAVDQPGEPLLMVVPQTISLPPTTSSAAFDFVAAGPGGFSVVLESTDVVEPAPDCGDVDCEGHAELHTRGVVLQVVPGRITGGRFDFAGDPLLAVEPMRLSLTSAPQGSYVTLRDAVVARLTNGGSPLIDTALIGKLQGTSIAGSDLPGVKGYKAGFINQVLFATLDLLRSQALMAVSCGRTALRPGVVLGWLEQAGGVWTWHCAYRHAWEPPTGFTQALLGGSCSDPSGLYRDVVEALIAGYAPPDPPPAGGGPVLEPPVFEYCPKGKVLVGKKCVNIYYPPPKIPDKWVKPWIPDLLGPVWYPPELEYPGIEPPLIYETDPWEFFGAGVINVLPALGRDATISKGVLEDTITDLAATPNVLVATAAEVVDMPGYEPGGSFSPSDTIVFTADAQNMVVAMGRVPASFTARKIGTELPAVTAKATEALDAVGEQGVVLGTVQQEVNGLTGDVAGFKAFQETTGQWRVGVEQTLGGLDTLVQQGIEQVVGSTVTDLQRRIATVEGSVDILKGRGGVVVGGGTVGGGTVGGVGGVLRLDQDFARGMTEFAETVNASLTTLVNPENERTLGRYVGDATRAAAHLEVVAAGGDPVEIGDAAVRLMGTLRTAVKAAGIEPGLAKQLDTQFNAVKGMLG